MAAKSTATATPKANSRLKWLKQNETASGSVGSALVRIATAGCKKHTTTEPAITAASTARVNPPKRQITRQNVGLGGEVGHRLAGVEVDQLAAERLGLKADHTQTSKTGVHRGGQPTGPPADHGQVIRTHHARSVKRGKTLLIVPLDERRQSPVRRRADSLPDDE